MFHMFQIYVVNILFRCCICCSALYMCCTSMFPIFHIFGTYIISVLFEFCSNYTHMLTEYVHGVSNNLSECRNNYTHMLTEYVPSVFDN